MNPDPRRSDQQSLTRRFIEVRAQSLKLAAPLSIEDQQVQSMEDASPTKWHLAHTTWFYEQFILQSSLGDAGSVGQKRSRQRPAKARSREYHCFDPEFAYLFNSYYDAVGSRHPRPQRGLLTRPSLQRIHEYRAQVDQSMLELLASGDATDALLARLELGLNHEQQHQELMLSDVQHLLSLSPLSPTYSAAWAGLQELEQGASRWLRVAAGEGWIGHDGQGFAFDNEGPRHRLLVPDFELRSDLVSEGEWLQFVNAGAYAQPQWWMADGWARVRAEGWVAPLYWRQRDDHWRVFDLRGERALEHSRPVAHLSWYEADAFARWSGARLATEQEWEVAAQDAIVAPNLDSLCTALWQWTASAYAPYPGFKPLADGLGEYNGKFMCNQFVLRGGAHATPAGHSRLSYRNFYYPHQRWQFAGVRLARDC